METKVEFQHAMIRAEELRDHHLNQSEIAMAYIRLATDENTMAKFLRISKYHAKRAEQYSKISEDLRKVLFSHEE